MDLPSLQLYKSKGCTIVVGDLYISSLPVSIYRTVLHDNLQTVRIIRGDIYIVDNEYLTALTFFSNLNSVNGVHLLNNPVLVDARLPALTSYGGVLTVEGCDRLCPARYPMLGVAPDDSSCSNPALRYFFNVRGSSSASDLSSLASVITRVVYNVTKGQVCFVVG